MSCAVFMDSSTLGPGAAAGTRDSNLATGWRLFIPYRTSSREYASDRDLTMGRMGRVPRAAALLLLVLAMGTVMPAAAAAAHRYRIYGTHAASYLARTANDSGAMYGVRCWVFDGSASAGWAHAECVGSLNYRGTVYRFKNVFTPLAPTKCVEHITVPGVAHFTEYVKKAATFRALAIR